MNRILTLIERSAPSYRFWYVVPSNVSGAWIDFGPNLATDPTPGTVNELLQTYPDSPYRTGQNIRKVALSLRDRDGNDFAPVGTWDWDIIPATADNPALEGRMIISDRDAVRRSTVRRSEGTLWNMSPGNTIRATYTDGDGVNGAAVLEYAVFRVWPRGARTITRRTVWAEIARESEVVGVEAANIVDSAARSLSLRVLDADVFPGQRCEFDGLEYIVTHIQIDRRARTLDLLRVS